MTWEKLKTLAFLTLSPGLWPAKAVCWGSNFVGQKAKEVSFCPGGRINCHNLTYLWPTSEATSPKFPMPTVNSYLPLAIRKTTSFHSLPLLFGDLYSAPYHGSLNNHLATLLLLSNQNIYFLPLLSPVLCPHTAPFLILSVMPPSFPSRSLSSKHISSMGSSLFLADENVAMVRAHDGSQRAVWGWWYLEGRHDSSFKRWTINLSNSISLFPVAFIHPSTSPHLMCVPFHWMTWINKEMHLYLYVKYNGFSIQGK